MNCGDPRCQTCTPRDELAPVVTTISYPSGVVVELLGGPAVPEPSKPPAAPVRRFPAAVITLGPRPKKLF